MNKFLATLMGFEVLAWSCGAQESAISGVKNPNGSDPGNSVANGEPVTYYASLNRRVIELKSQSDLLNQLAQEHRKRAEQAPRAQPDRAQWESELAKELGDQSAALLASLNNMRKEQVRFEEAHPEVAAGVLPNSLTVAPSTHNPDEVAFMGKLEERLAAVQQEIADTLEAGRIYTAQLQTNTASLDFSRVALLIQENGKLVRQLQKESADLELRKLEFRALHKQ